jgi:thiol:disulfide interchange protein DsbD
VHHLSGQRARRAAFAGGGGRLRAKGCHLSQGGLDQPSAEIATALGTFGRNGVPLYVVYPAGATGAPTVLPQILSEGTILEAIEGL